MSTAAKAASAAPWSLIAKATRFVFSLAASMIVVRMLPAEEYGVLAIVRTIVAFVAAVAGFGMGNVVVRYLPEKESLASGSRSLLKLAMGTQLVGWLVFTLVVWLLRGSIDAHYGSAIGTPLLAGVAFLSGNLAFNVLQSALTAKFRTRPLAFIQVALSVAILLASWGALRAGWGVLGVLAAGSIPYAIAAGLVAPMITRSLSPGDRPKGDTGRLYRYGFPLAAVEILNLVTWRQSETLLLGHFCGPAEAGVFDIAYRLPQIVVEFVPETIWPLVLAAFAEVYTRKKHEIAGLVRHYFRVLFLLVTPVTVFGALYGDILIETLYGVERATAGVYARLFFVIFHLSFFGTPYSMAIYLLEKTWVNLVLSGLFAVINLGLDLILIPRYGLPGAVPPVAIAVGISPFLRAWAVRRLHGPIGVPWKFLARCYLFSAPVALAWPIRRAFDPAISLMLLAVSSAVLLFLGARVVRPLQGEARVLIERTGLPGKERLLHWFA